MKYFKHYANASHSESLGRLLNDLGNEGYGTYWLLLELLCERFDGESVEFTINERDISAKVGIKFSKKLATFLGKLADFSLITANKQENFWKIEAPILLDLQSRDYKKARKSRTQTAPKNKIKIKIKEEEEKETSSPSSMLRINIVMNFYNQILSGLECARWNATTEKMNQAFELAVKHLPTYEDWKKYFTAIKQQEFKGVEKITPQFVLSENVIARYLNGEFEKQDFDLMLEEFIDEVQKEN
jgi:hypothetical protein